MEFKDLAEIAKLYELACKEVRFIKVTDEEANLLKSLYPRWEDCKGLSIGDYVTYMGKLYRVNQPIPIISEYQTPNSRSDLYIDVDQKKNDKSTEELVNNYEF